MIKIDEFLRKIRSVRVLNLESKQRLAKLEAEAVIKFNKGNKEWLKREEEKVSEFGIALGKFIAEE